MSIQANSGPPWLAAGEPMQISAAERKLAYASRRHPQPVAPLGAREAWRRLRGKHMTENCVFDTAKTDPGLVAAYLRAIDRMNSVEPPAQADAGADGLMLAFALSMNAHCRGDDEKSDGAVVDYLVAQFGLLYAVEAFLAAQRVTLSANIDQEARVFRPCFGTEVYCALDSRWAGELSVGEEGLRKYLAAAPLALWQSCVERIEAALPKLAPVRQPIVALLLPDRPELSNEVALRLATLETTDAFGEKALPKTLHWLFSCATDPSALAVVAQVDEWRFWYEPRMTFTLLVERGVAAVGILKREAGAKGAGDALACVGTPDAIEALARVADKDRDARQRLTVASNRWPLAAIAALAPLIDRVQSDVAPLAERRQAGENARKAAGLWLSVFAPLLRSHRDAVPALRPWLEPSAWAVVEKQLALLGGEAELASLSELPRVLSAPPWLAKAGKKPAVRRGREDVAGAPRAVSNEDPLDCFPVKRVKLPEWALPGGWRRPVLKAGGKALPDEALESLAQMLTFPTHEGVYAGIADVRVACTPESLAEFAWDVFSAWLASGAPAKDIWALTGLGLLGNDDTARKLTPLIRAWPGEAAHARAVTGLDVLGGIGSDVALMLLNGIAQKVKFKGLQDKAREKIQAIADTRGLTTEELEDRLAPDLGLDDRGTLKLDFGPRAFMVGFDETLKPYVRELDAEGQSGARLADLPKPKKTDDAALSKEAVERFKLLKKDARTVASQQLLRLEVAMCARRRWTPELFRTFLVEHPLVRHLVQRLIWGVYEVEGGAEADAGGGNYGGMLKSCFRVAQDGGFTTAEDDPFEIPVGDNIRVGVPHTLEISVADVAAFGQVFADYELLQPFAQIGRDTYVLTDAERTAGKLTRWNGVTVPTGRVLGLVNKGWRRGQAQDAGCIWYFVKPLGADRVIELHLDPGIIVGMVAEYPEQTLGELQVGKPAPWGELKETESFSRLDAISASELIRDMEALRG